MTTRDEQHDRLAELLAEINAECEASSDDDELPRRPSESSFELMTPGQHSSASSVYENEPGMSSDSTLPSALTRSLALSEPSDLDVQSDDARVQSLRSAEQSDATHSDANLADAAQSRPARDSARSSPAATRPERAHASGTDADDGRHSAASPGAVSSLYAKVDPVSLNQEKSVEGKDEAVVVPSARDLATGDATNESTDGGSLPKDKASEGAARAGHVQSDGGPSKLKSPADSPAKARSSATNGSPSKPRSPAASDAADNETPSNSRSLIATIGDRGDSRSPAATDGSPSKPRSPAATDGSSSKPRSPAATYGSPSKPRSSAASESSSSAADIESPSKTLSTVSTDGSSSKPRSPAATDGSSSKPRSPAADIESPSETRSPAATNGSHSEPRSPGIHESPGKLRSPTADTGSPRKSRSSFAEIDSPSKPHSPAASRGSPNNPRSPTPDKLPDSLDVEDLSPKLGSKSVQEDRAAQPSIPSSGAQHDLTEGLAGEQQSADAPESASPESADTSSMRAVRGESLRPADESETRTPLPSREAGTSSDNSALADPKIDDSNSTMKNSESGHSIDKRASAEPKDPRSGEASSFASSPRAQGSPGTSLNPESDTDKSVTNAAPDKAIQGSAAEAETDLERKRAADAAEAEADNDEPTKASESSHESGPSEPAMSELDFEKVESTLVGKDSGAQDTTEPERGAKDNALSLDLSGAAKDPLDEIPPADTSAPELTPRDHDNQESVKKLTSSTKNVPTNEGNSTENHVKVADAEQPTASEVVAKSTSGAGKAEGSEPSSSELTENLDSSYKPTSAANDSSIESGETLASTTGWAASSQDKQEISKKDLGSGESPNEADPSKDLGSTADAGIPSKPTEKAVESVSRAELPDNSDFPLPQETPVEQDKVLDDKSESISKSGQEEQGDDVHRTIGESELSSSKSDDKGTPSGEQKGAVKGDGLPDAEDAFAATSSYESSSKDASAQVAKYPEEGRDLGKAAAESSTSEKSAGSIPSEKSPDISSSEDTTFNGNATSIKDTSKEVGSSAGSLANKVDTKESNDSSAQSKPTPVESSEPLENDGPAQSSQDDPNIVYVYMSFASGVRGTMSRYNRAVNILNSYDIKFETVEVTMDPRAKRLWKYKGVSKNKVLPAVFRDGDLKCDYNELLEANEYEDVEGTIFDGL